MGSDRGESIDLTSSSLLTITQLGLAAVPALPFMFDKPVEEATEWLFYNTFKAIGGEQAVGNRESEHGHRGTSTSRDALKKDL